MREIRFRAYCKDQKDFIFSDLNNIDDDLFGRHGVLQSEVFEPWQQFTGLKDKNGVEIYEGDIYHQGDKNILYIVEYVACGFVGRQLGNKSCAGIEYFLNDIEIVGNIHENPELHGKVK